MMDAMSDDPIEMIARLARSMMAERRGRFLDAACGGDAKLRAEVEARLGHPKQDGTVEEPPGSAHRSAPESRARIDRIHRFGGTLGVPRPDRSQSDDSDTELQEDLPIDAYCDQKQLDTLARLRLFQQVCRAIDQDHRHGLIHGGLTPNQSGSSPDGSLSLHVIPREPSAQPDEGLLKAGYASPEQVLGEPVTTATDVYQLGVLLYELLTGRGPYRFHSQDADELCNAISEQSPERPSLAVIQPDHRRRLAEPIAERGGHRRKALNTCLPVISN